MSLEKLVEVLEEKARAEREELMDRARARAAEILADARKEAADRRDEYLARVERDARAAARANGAEARREARARVLEARAEGLEKLFDAVRARFPDAVGSPAFREALPEMLASALEHVGRTDVVVLCPPALVAAVEDALPEDEGAPAEPEREVPGVEVTGDEEAEPGFRLLGDDGELIVDGSLEAALRRLRPRLCIELVTSIEGEDEPRESAP